MQRIEWAVKNDVFVKYGEMLLRYASWKLLSGSLLRSGVAPAIMTVKPQEEQVANGALNM